MIGSLPCGEQISEINADIFNTVSEKLNEVLSNTVSGLGRLRCGAFDECVCRNRHDAYHLVLSTEGRR